MNICFPGTVIPRNGKKASELFEGLFFVTKGITLSQVREITGLDTTSIQNWVVRGWVQHPVDKRYGANHLARIMLINMLKTVTRLEHVAKIMTYINGSPECREDDVISETELYIAVCDILDTADYETILSPSALDGVIKRILRGYSEPFIGARTRLENGIKLILFYYSASIIKVRADKLAQELELGGDLPDCVLSVQLDPAFSDEL
ncbi:MAG: DUF1836 domain-containing protein [Oscillospiraceae bacterium]|nr:DUF1836 domain-containing protein [Oscillospiraceae bacterium]MBQ3049126.1 DUF1836 domain-containing protein [Oscillospiraceae bacterium]